MGPAHLWRIGRRGENAIPAKRKACVFRFIETSPLRLRREYHADGTVARFRPQRFSYRRRVSRRSMAVKRKALHQVPPNKKRSVLANGSDHQPPAPKTNGG
jgi:hypothetical protein